MASADGRGDGSPNPIGSDYKISKGDSYFYSTSSLSSLNLSQSYSYNNNLPDGMSSSGSNLNLNVFSNSSGLSSNSCTNSPNSFSRLTVVGHSPETAVQAAASYASSSSNATAGPFSETCALANSGLLALSPKDQLKQFFDACKTGDIIRVKQLGNSVNVNARDTGRRSTPLHFACGYGRTDVVEYLLSLGSSINARDEGGLHVLHNACRYVRQN